MSSNKRIPQKMHREGDRVDWTTTADILDNATDEEIEEALEKLNPFPGMTAGEAVEAELKMFKEMGLMPQDEEDDG